LYQITQANLLRELYQADTLLVSLGHRQANISSPVHRVLSQPAVDYTILLVA